MKRKLLKTMISVIMGLVLSNTTLFAQELISTVFKYDEVSRFLEDGLRRVSSNGKHGFVDFEGNEVIPLKYDDAFCFQNGMAPVRLNDKWGYINTDDNLVIPCIYDIAYNFQDDVDLACVVLDGKRGFIDKTGKVVVPIIYEEEEKRWYHFEIIGKLEDTRNYEQYYPGEKYDAQSLKKRFRVNVSVCFLDLRHKLRFAEGFAGVSKAYPEFVAQGEIEMAKKQGRPPIVPIKWGFVNQKGEEVFWGYRSIDESFGNWSIFKEKKHSKVAAVTLDRYLWDRGGMFIDVLGNEYPFESGSSSSYQKALNAANKTMKKYEKQQQ